MIIQDLQSDLYQVQEVASRASDQLGRAHYVRDDAWSQEYLEGLERMFDYVILNPQESSKVLETHLRLSISKTLALILLALIMLARLVGR